MIGKKKSDKGLEEVDVDALEQTAKELMNDMEILMSLIDLEIDAMQRLINSMDGIEVIKKKQKNHKK